MSVIQLQETILLLILLHIFAVKLNHLIEEDKNIIRILLLLLLDVFRVEDRIFHNDHLLFQFCREVITNVRNVCFARLIF